MTPVFELAHLAVTRVELQGLQSHLAVSKGPFIPHSHTVSNSPQCTPFILSISPGKQSAQEEGSTLDVG